GRSHACERCCGHYWCSAPGGGFAGFGMSGCCGHHAPVPGAPRSPGELTSAEVRWSGQSLSRGNYWRPGGRRSRISEERPDRRQLWYKQLTPATEGLLTRGIWQAERRHLDLARGISSAGRNGPTLSSALPVSATGRADRVSAGLAHDRETREGA